MRKTLDKILEFIMVVILGFMVVMGGWQVVSRYCFNAPSTISEEVLRFSLIWLSMLGAAYIFGKREHMSMTFILDKLNKKGQLVLSVISEIVVAIFAVLVLVYGGISITSLTLSQISPSLGASMGYIYMVLPISGIFTLVYTILNVKDLLSGKIKAEDAESVDLG